MKERQKGEEKEYKDEGKEKKDGGKNKKNVKFVINNYLFVSKP